MYTAAALKTKTVKDLGRLATKFGVTGWRSMRKDELVRALVRAAKRKANAAASRKASTSTPKRTTKKASTHGRTAPRKTATRRSTPVTKSAKSPAKANRTSRRIQKANADRARHKNLAVPSEVAKEKLNGRRRTPVPTLKRDGRKDRIVLLVRDAYWIQAWWELTRHSIDRAKAAMAEQWHTAKPVLRLVQVEASGSNSSAERVVRDIEIHGGVKTWYVDIQDSPRSYRIDIGYLASNGKFFKLARSNSVTTPRPNHGDMIEEDWSDIADNCEKIYALSGGYTDERGSGDLQELFEERLGRPMGSPVAARYGVGAEKMLNRHRAFPFEVDAEMIIYGTSDPNAHVTLAGTPVQLRPDGSFSARLSMPDRRQVLPIVASSADGVEQRTVVLAIERNTKVMEPMVRESSD